MEPKKKAFDAVAESRKWREATSRKLDAMSVQERLAYLRTVRARFLAKQKQPRGFVAPESLPPREKE